MTHAEQIATITALGAKWLWLAEAMNDSTTRTKKEHESGDCGPKVWKALDVQLNRHLAELIHVASKSSGWPRPPGSS